MSVLAIVHPLGLTAKELREQLASRRELWQELRLLSPSEDEVGTLTEAGGAAGMVQRATPEALEGVDLAFFCGPIAESRPLLDAAPAGMRAVLLSADATVADAPPCVAGINLGEAAPARVLLSPHPGAILLSHLLHPLAGHGLRRAEATLLQPVSVFPGEALDQLFAQARSLLTFQPVEEAAHWQRQLAFNLLLGEHAGELRAQVEAVLGGTAEVTAQVVQAGVFHGFSVSLHVFLEPDPGASAMREALVEHPRVRWADEDPLGPVDAAAAEDVLLGELRADRGRPGSYWLWSVMDNLTRGGASNALALAATLLG